MARPARSISPETQALIIQRLSEGVAINSVAEETGIPASTIRSRFSRVSAQTKAVANQLATAEDGLRSLPVLAQSVALSLAEKIRRLSESVTDVAVKGAAVAEIMMGEAERRGRSIDSSSSIDDLGALSGCVRTATEAVKPALTLLAMQKEAAKPEVDAPKIMVSFDE